MRIFISWSQPDSKKIAQLLKAELTTLFNEKIEFWVSADDISSGCIGINSIVQALTNSDMIITCLDSDNYKNPWLYFETGAVFGKKYDGSDETSVTFPIIFDELEIEDFKNTPFEHLQLMKFNESQLRSMVESINKKYEILTNNELLNARTLERYFESAWNNIHSSVNTIIAQRNIGDDSVLNSENIVERLKRYSDFPEAKRGKTIRYDSGFETVAFYKFLLENVKKRLYVFGRKNRKIISNDLKNQFKNILDNDEVELRILYIHPDSDEVKKGTAQDTIDFRTHLITCMKSAVERFGDDFKIEDYCRTYDVKRMSEIIVADDVVFYKDLGYTKNGKPAHFTGESFNVVSVDSKIGTSYYNKFIEVWEKSNELTKDYINSL